MDNIIVGFSKPKKWKPFAWLIMIGYGIPYDHVYIKLYLDDFENFIVFQASQLTVNLMGSYFFENNNIIDEFELPISKNNKKDLLNFCYNTIGKPYSIKEAIGLALIRIFQLFDIKFNNPFNGYVCSTLVGYILKGYLNKDISDNINNLSPLDIYNYLIKFKENTK